MRQLNKLGTKKKNRNNKSIKITDTRRSVYRINLTNGDSQRDCLLDYLLIFLYLMMYAYLYCNCIVDLDPGRPKPCDTPPGAEEEGKPGSWSFRRLSTLAF